MITDATVRFGHLRHDATHGDPGRGAGPRLRRERQHGSHAGHAREDQRALRHQAQ